jgi:toxin ParE1/3/4
MAARALIGHVRKGCVRFESLPEIGRAGRVPGMRELVVSGTPYIAPYRVRDDAVEIIAVLHGARRWPEAF